MMVFSIGSVGADKLKIQPQTKEWCRLPYPGHPEGCPNYGKKVGCPPDTPMIGDFFDLSKLLIFVVARFDIEEHINKMKSIHPDWTDRQARCCLYWQGSVRKELRNEVKRLVAFDGNLTWTDCPEAMGLNVLRTMNIIGVPVKRIPRKYIYKVALIGYKK